MIALAALPLALVLALMAGRRWSGGRAAFAGWLTAVAIAFGPYGMAMDRLGWAQLKGVFASLDVLAIIWSAFALSHVIAEAGALATLSGLVARLTVDRSLQMLILAWVFAALVQGVTGFGVPIAVVAPLLVAMGFPVLPSVVATAIGHAWAVTFGSLGSSVAALGGATGLSPAQLAPASAAVLGVVCVACGLTVAYVHNGWLAVRHAQAAILVIGGVMAAAQYVVASSRLWNLAAFVAALSGLGVSQWVARWPRYRRLPAARVTPAPTTVAADRQLPLRWAVAGYWLLLGFVLVHAALPPLARLLQVVTLQFPPAPPSPGVAGSHRVAAAASFSLLGSSGALIAYAALASYLVYRWQGRYRRDSGRHIMAATWRSAIRPTGSILLLMALAMTMADSGMTDRLAAGLSAGMGKALPLVAPWLGALGAFMTGSNTHSNVVFGALQRSMAGHAGYEPVWILAAQNAGGAVGSVFSPAKVAVAAGLVGLAGQEHTVLRRTMVVAAPMLVLAGLLTFAALGGLPRR